MDDLTNAVSRTSPSGTDWEQTFRRNNPASPKAVPSLAAGAVREKNPSLPNSTNWQETFGRNNPFSPSGTDWQKRFSGGDSRRTGNADATPAFLRGMRTAIGSKALSFFQKGIRPDVQNGVLQGVSTDLSQNDSQGYDEEADMPESSFSRITSADLNDYGAGDDYGFSY